MSTFIIACNIKCLVFIDIDIEPIFRMSNFTPLHFTALYSSCCSNVVQAMGLRQHPLLSHIRQILLKDPIVLLSAIDAMPGKPCSVRYLSQHIDIY